MSNLYAGFAQAMITPPMDTPMLGFLERDQEKGCQSIHDDIYATVLYLEQDNQPCVIVGYDLCFLGQHETDAIKKTIAPLGIREDQILLNCSHNHAGPATASWGVPLTNPRLQEYLQTLCQTTRALVEQARNNKQPAQLASAQGKTSLPMSRRFQLEDGSITNAPNPEGVVYDALSIIQVSDQHDEVICCMVSLAAHPSALSSHIISAEYPGAIRNRLNDYFKKPVTLFLQGPAGDLKTTVGRKNEREWAWWEDNWDYLNQATDIVEKELIDLLNASMTGVTPALRTTLLKARWLLEPPPSDSTLEDLANKPIPKGDRDQLVMTNWARAMLELKTENGGCLPDHIAITTQIIQLGDALRMVALEGEPVAELGWLMHSAFEDGVTVALGYSNGSGMYLPCDRMLPEGGYEVESFHEYGQPARLAPGIDENLKRTLQQCIQHL